MAPSGLRKMNGNIFTYHPERPVLKVFKVIIVRHFLIQYQYEVQHTYFIYHPLPVSQTKSIKYYFSKVNIYVCIIILVFHVFINNVIAFWLYMYL